MAEAFLRSTLSPRYVGHYVRHVECYRPAVSGSTPDRHFDHVDHFHGDVVPGAVASPGTGSRHGT